jgi:Mn-dependent DtxR family transcriptional regulator
MDVDLTPEMVDYLVSIYVLTYKRGCRCVKPVEISKTLGASKATVSLMLKKLRFKGLVTKEKDGVGLSQRGVVLMYSYSKKACHDRESPHEVRYRP